MILAIGLKHPNGQLFDSSCSIILTSDFDNATLHPFGIGIGLISDGWKWNTGNVQSNDWLWGFI